MTLSKVSFSDILRNDYLDHFNTFGENFDYDTFKNDTFENYTFECVWVDRHPHVHCYINKTQKIILTGMILLDVGVGNTKIPDYLQK